MPYILFIIMAANIKEFNGGRNKSIQIDLVSLQRVKAERVRKEERGEERYTGENEAMDKGFAPFSSL